jgi:hypothetical protein
MYFGHLGWIRKGDRYMTRPREWPNGAKEARDRAAEEAVRGIRHLEPVLERNLSEEEKTRRVGIGLSALHKIARLLEKAGAKTEP